MIDYVEKGRWLHQAIEAAGHWLMQLNGDWASSDDGIVQGMIDAFDPLPFAQTEAIEKINTAAGAARSRYVTNVPHQDATYQLKLEDCLAFAGAGYPESELADYPFVAAEAEANGTSGQAAAELVIATYNSWKHLAARIEGKRRAGINAVNAVADWRECMAVAEGFVTQIEAI
ncbi:hypothetical protein [Methylophaga lonarensis]|uniref:hypothetical protein n=1 Tax=Methylophaga lonarensis TaxID=999151 RepID=UPI003D2C2994